MAGFGSKGRGRMVLPAMAAGEVAAIAGAAGTASKAKGAATTGVAQATSGYLQAREKAKADIAIAKYEAAASKFTTSVQESDEILSITDRPFLRINYQVSPQLSIEANLSLMTLFGLLAVNDINEQYIRLQRAYEIAGLTKDARDNTQTFNALLGVVPLEPTAIAQLAEVIDTTTPGAEGSSSQTKKAIHDKILDAIRRTGIIP